MQPKKSKGELTRERLVKVAGELFQARGYQAVGLNEICAAGELPKGSVYYHFPKGKEEIAVAVIQTSQLEIGRAIEQAAAVSKDLEQFVALVGGSFAENLHASDFTKGCPITTINLEMAASSKPIRLACASAFTHWIDLTALALKKMDVSASEADQAAEFLFSTIEGALVLARAQQSIEPINRAIHNIQQYLRIGV